MKAEKRERMKDRMTRRKACIDSRMWEGPEDDGGWNADN